MPRTLPKSDQWYEPELPFPTTPNLDVFECTILGDMPRPQGSLRHVGGGRLIYGDELMLWRQLVQHEAAEAKPRDWVPIDDACHVDLCFAFRQPKSTPKWRRDFPFNGKGSDLDKLTRAILDAVDRAGVITDDSRVASITAAKTFAGVGPLPDIGVSIRIEPIPLPER